MKYQNEHHEFLYIVICYHVVSTHRQLTEPKPLQEVKNDLCGILR